MAAHVTTAEVDGSPVPIAARSPLPSRLTLRLRGVSTLTLSLTGYELDKPDPYLGKPIVLKVDGVPVFAGDVVDRPVEFTRHGWGAMYQCRDLRARGDKIPFTDSNTLGNVAVYNADPEDRDKIDGRLGMTVGEILADVLTMQQNADGLAAYGIGGYTSLSPPTLPAETLADLAAMDVIPPNPVQVGGDNFFRSVAAFCGQWAPNHAPTIRPDGVIRFIDLRSPAEHVLTFGDCAQRVDVSGLSRSVAECSQRVVVRGKSIALPKLLTLSNGGLLEDFAWGTLDNAGAKAAWTPQDFLADQEARSTGTLACTDATHVVLSSDPGTQTWTSNEWNQANRRGVLYAWSTVTTGIDQFATSRVIANTAKSSGGSSTFTLETPLPHLDFDGYVLYGISSGAALVWRKYKAADPAIRAALAKRFSFPVIQTNASQSAQSLRSEPQASITWRLPGGTLANEVPVPIVDIDLAAGTFLLSAPTYNLAGGPPDDVRVFAAVNTGVLQVVKPASGFEGTSHDVEGLEDTLTIQVDSWRDPANLVNIEKYAQDQLDSVKDAIVEGAVTVHDLFVPGLTFGLGLSVAGDGYSTGWETLNAPVIETDVTWNSGAGSHYTTTMQVSNRRASYAVGAYLQPERRLSEYAADAGAATPMPMPMGPMTPTSPPPDAGAFDAPPDGDAAGMLDADWSLPGGNLSGRYGRRRRRAPAPGTPIVGDFKPLDPEDEMLA